MEAPDEAEDKVLGAVGGSAVSESSPPEGGLPSEREEEEDEEETLTADDCESSISGISDLLQGSVLGRVEDLLDDGRDANQPEATHPEMEGEGEGGGAALADCVLLSTSLDRPVELRLADKGAGSEPPVTVVQLFQQAAERHAGRKALCVKRVGVWKSWTYQRYQEESVALAKAFIKLGLEPWGGVCILGFNSPEWFITNMAAMMAGGIPVGLYLSHTVEGCHFVASDCKANIIVVDSDQQMSKILSIRKDLPHLKAVIQYLGTPPAEEGVHEWSRVVALGFEEGGVELERRTKLLSPGHCCTLIYTSGTTGTPKGVMLSHDNVAWNTQMMFRALDKHMAQEHVVSYLPLAHIAAQILDIYVTMASGGTTWFALPDALKGSLIQTMREVRPTIFLGVPRVWEKLASGMHTYASSMGRLKRGLSNWAKEIGLRGNMSRQQGGSTPLGWTIAKLTVFQTVAKQLGLDRCHHHLTGAAPLSNNTLRYFLSLNVLLHKLYGMTETTGPTTVTTEKTLRFGSNGYAIAGADIKIEDPDEDGVGEVVISGRHVFMGYLNSPEKTWQVFTKEGYLRSGDYGYLDKDKHLYITGRIKEIIALNNGDKVAPVPVEQMIKAELPIVSNAIVIGDQRIYLVCLITLKVEMDDQGLPTNLLTQEARRECQKVGSNSETVDAIIDGSGDGAVLKMIKKGIDRVNARASTKAQKVLRWTVLEGDFSIAGGELTPTLKLKRQYITTLYAEHIDYLY